jgi:SNF2 family DNA or RNA helicase
MGYQYALNEGASHLNDFQKDVIEECIRKGCGGLSLPMGSGKTLISLIVALSQSIKYNTKEPILVVATKSLIVSWETEIKKFFGDKLKYEIFYKNPERFKIKEDTIILLTTPETLSKCYKHNHINNKFVDEDLVNVRAFDYYNREINVSSFRHPINPFLDTLTSGLSYVYSTRFSSFIVDEVQKFTNIETTRCRSIGSICSTTRWVLSGTMFDEPKLERILGYYIIIDHPTFPRNLVDAKNEITNINFKGLSKTLVKRDKNIVFTPPKLNKIIISHNLSVEESVVYLTMKKTLHTLKEYVKRLRLGGTDADRVKRFSSYLLAMITYLRQGLVCPLIPVANITLDMADHDNKSDLSTILQSEFNKAGIEEWMNNTDSIKSTRIKKVLETLDKHNDEKVVMFTCFRTSVNVINYFINDRKVLMLTPNMSIAKRGKIIEEFQNEEDKNTILFLTYELGAEGLNLQCSHTVLIIDFWWNSGKTSQAIARVLRFGQMSDTVNVYFFTGNTGIEKALFTKQQDKLTILGELENGPLKSIVKKMTIDSVLKIIELGDNVDSLTNIN